MRELCITPAAIAVSALLAASAGWGQMNTAAPAPAPTVSPIQAQVLTPPPLPSGASTPVPAGRPLTVKEAIGIALRNQPQLALSDASVVSARGALQQARSALLPSIGLSANYSKSGPSSGGLGAGGFSSLAYGTSLSGRQLIYDFGQSIAGVRQARRQEESARQGLAQTAQDVVDQVKQSYYVLLQNQRLVEVQHTNVADQQAHLDLAKARFDAGFAPRADVVRAETAVANAIFNLATAENAAALARVNLNIAIGVDARTPTAVEEAEEPAPEAAVETLIEQALANRPDAKQARANVAAAEQGLAAARTGNLPAVVAGADYGFVGSTFPPDNKNWSYSVSVQWPLFDSGLTRGRVQAAQGGLLSARAAQRQTEQTVGSEVTQAYLNLQTAQQKVADAAAEVANAQESMNLATGQYQAGVAIYVTVLDAETALITARTNQVNALYSVSTARSALKRALGLQETTQ